MVKGVEYKKGQYVVFTDEELKAPDEKATNGLRNHRVPAQRRRGRRSLQDDLLLGPDKGGERATRCSQATTSADEIAPGQIRGARKSYLVLIRSTGDRLFMQQLYHSDEVRDIGEVPLESLPQQRGGGEACAPAHRAGSTSGTFKPEEYGRRRPASASRP